MLKMIIRGITWLCPCWLVDRNKQTRTAQQVQVQIEMIDYPFIKRVNSQQHIPESLNKEKYHTPTDQKVNNLQFPKRFSKVQNSQNINLYAQSDKLKQSDDFLSFKRSESLIKKNFRVIKISGDTQDSLFQSFSRITFENKEQYQQMISNYSSFIQTTQGKQTKFRESELLELQRFKKRLIVQTQNQIQQFEYFISDNDVIYQNKQMNMIVELKQGQQVFQTKTYCTLCRLKCPPVPIISVLKILNSYECQNIYCSFKSIKSVSKNTHVIVEVQKINKCLFNSITLKVTKFLTLLQTQEQNKIYVVEIDSDINLETFSNIAQQTYRKITRIVREQDNTLSLEIFMEQSLNLNPGISIHKYYTDIFQNFTKYFTKKLKSL